MLVVSGQLGRRVGPGNTLARLGGDEFAYLGEDGTDPGVAAARTRAALTAVHDLAGTPTTTTVSAGLAHLPATAPTPTSAELLARADAALYAAKRSGRARLVTHTHTLTHTGHAPAR